MGHTGALQLCISCDDCWLLLRCAPLSLPARCRDRLKNADCKLSQELRCLKSSNRLLLTGEDQKQEDRPVAGLTAC
jgi:hypothetical protein